MKLSSESLGSRGSFLGPRRRRSHDINSMQRDLLIIPSRARFYICRIDVHNVTVLDIGVLYAYS